MTPRGEGEKEEEEEEEDDDDDDDDDDEENGSEKYTTSQEGEEENGSKKFTTMISTCSTSDAIEGKPRKQSKLMRKFSKIPSTFSKLPKKISKKMTRKKRIVSDEEQKRVLHKCVKECLDLVFKRAEYAALKVIAYSFASGLHIAASKKCLTSERHAILVSSQEVIYFRQEGVISCTWVAFLQKYPYWRTVARPEDNLVAAEVVARAQKELANPQNFGSYNSVLNNSEHFATYCYSGSRCSNDVRSSAAGATAGLAMAAGGANLALGLSTATETSYILGILPFGTVTTFSVATFAAVAGGLVVAGFVIAPLSVQAYRYFVQSQELPVAFINDTTQIIYVKAYPSVTAELVEPGSMIEITPAVGVRDEFDLSVFKSRFDWANSGTLTVRRGNVVRYCDDVYHIVPRECLPAYAPE